jgi:peptide-methionine (S)-S-oxide reductase
MSGRSAPDGGLERATLGGGCFWCVEAVLQRLEGVHAVTSGYAGGHSMDPTYADVCAGWTGHAEVVRVEFDPEVLSYRDLLQVFFATHDPTTPNRQGHDAGTQYRSILLYETPEQRATADAVMRELDLAGVFPAPIVTELEPLDRFYPAEPEHHDYYRLHPNQPYCRVVIDPKLARLRARFAERLRRE